MKTRFAARIVALLGAAAGIGFATTAAAQNKELGSTGELLDGVAAVVDDGVVLKSELEERINIVAQNLRAQQAQQPPEQRRQLPPASVIEKQVLDQLVLKQIQLQRAKRLGITVGDDTLNQALSQVAQNLGYTLAELPAVLAGENIDYTMYREDSRDDLIIQQLRATRRIEPDIDHATRARSLSFAARSESLGSVRLQHLSHPDQRVVLGETETK